MNDFQPKLRNAVASILSISTILALALAFDQTQSLAETIADPKDTNGKATHVSRSIEQQIISLRREVAGHVAKATLLKHGVYDLGLIVNSMTKDEIDQVNTAVQTGEKLVIPNELNFIKGNTIHTPAALTLGLRHYAIASALAVLSTHKLIDLEILHKAALRQQLDEENRRAE